MLTYITLLLTWCYLMGAIGANIIVWTDLRSEPEMERMKRHPVLFALLVLATWPLLIVLGLLSPKGRL